MWHILKILMKNYQIIVHVFNNCFKQHFYFANGINNTICQMDFHTGSDNGAQWNVISNVISLGPESCWALLGIQLAAHLCKQSLMLKGCYLLSWILDFFVWQNRSIQYVSPGFGNFVVHLSIFWHHTGY